MVLCPNFSRIQPQHLLSKNIKGAEGISLFKLVFMLFKKVKRMPRYQKYLVYSWYGVPGGITGRADYWEA